MKSLALLFAIALLIGCDDRSELHVMTMRDQPVAKAQDSSNFFREGTASRDWPDSVVPFGGDLANATRPPIDLALLHRGQERFAIHCAMCHGDDGAGDGIVADHGFPRPPTFHSDRLNAMPDDDVYAVIVNGRGKMPPYGDQVSIRDRWAIVAYVRALQRSQRATVDDVPEAERGSLTDTQHPLPSDPLTNQP